MTTDPQAQITGRLKQLRADAGLSGKALADRYGWAQSKVSRLETGRYQPTNDDIEKWCAACGAPDGTAAELIALLGDFRTGHRDWRRELQTAALGQATYNQLVSASARICHFEMAMVPGLLQTPDYAHRVLSEGARLARVPAGEIAAGVAIRMQRQQMLYDGSKRFEFLLTETVLRNRITSASVMRSQLDRLQTAIGLPNVRFGIIPFAAQLQTIPQNSFQLYDDLAVVETWVGEWTHNPEDSGFYARHLEELWADATVGSAARQLIADAVASLPADETIHH